MPRIKILGFGSNLAGRHGLGSAAWAAKEFGAEYGVGVGRTGNAYAIPTKGYRLEILPLFEIEPYCREFVQYTHDHPEFDYLLVKIGCGLAGYKSAQIAPFFNGIPKYVEIHREWKSYVRYSDSPFPGGS